jgi:hypothetical protein
MIYSSKKAQAILDFVLVFGIILVFLVGLVRIWVWFNANYARRNLDYQHTRLIAGKPNNISAGIYIDRPLDLDEDWVFEGKPSGRVGGL